MEISKDTTCNSHISSHHNFKNKNKVTENFNSNFEVENSKDYYNINNNSLIIESNDGFANLKMDNKKRIEHALNNNGSYKFNL